MQHATLDAKINDYITRLVPTIAADVIAEFSAAGGTSEYAYEGSGWTMDVVFGRIIRGSERTLTAVALLSNIAFKALHAYSGPLDAFKHDLTQMSLLPDQAAHENQFSAARRDVARFLDEEPGSRPQFPEWAFDPYTTPTTMEERAIHDLYVMALVACALHEYKHVLIADSGQMLSPIEEELACDGYAAKTIMLEAPQYASATREPLQRVESKRAQGLFIFLSIILAVTPKKNWSGTDTHPPVRLRFERVLESISLPEDDLAWLLLSSLLVAIFQDEGVTLPCRTYSTYLELAHQLINVIR